MRVNVEWSWAWRSGYILLHTKAKAENGWVANTDRLYRREPEDEAKTDIELAIEQAEKAAEDVKARFGYETKVKLLAIENKHDLPTTSKAN
jgi:hypothetical protein